MADNLPWIELLKQAGKQAAFVFSCAPSGAAGDAVVPCLGVLDAPMLAYLAKRGIAVELRGSHHCVDCVHGVTGAAQLELNLEAVTKLRDAVEDEKWAEPVLAGNNEPGAVPTGEHVTARRQLFRRLIGRGVDEIARAATARSAAPVPEMAIRAGRPFITAQRELLQFVCKREDGKAAMLTPHAALPLLQLRLAPGCTACEACFRACPTAALDIKESSTAWALTFQFDRCVACGVCVEVCQPDVLHASETMDGRPMQEIVTLHALRKQRCQRCDRFFVSSTAAQVCSVCTDDEASFSAIFG